MRKIRLKYIATLFTGNSISDDDKPFYIENKVGYNYVSSKDIDAEYKVINLDTGMKVPYEQSNFKIAPKNSILLCIEGGSAGRKIGYVDENICFVNKLCCFVTNSIYECDSRYLYWALQSNYFIEQFNLNLSGLIGGVSINKLEQLYIPYHSIIKQKSIANKLDELCESINDEIKKVYNQIDILEKYKISFITEVLTKGVLDKEVKTTKDKWFKNIPYNWEVRKIKHILNEKNGIKVGPFGSSLTDKVVYDSGDIKVYGQWNVIDKDFSIDRNFINNEDFSSLSNYEVLPGDVLISMMGTIGRCLEVPINIQKGIMDSHIIKVRLGEKMDVEYFCYFYDKTLSNCIFKQLEFEKNGSIMDGLNSTIVKNLSILVPPIEEQRSIVKFIKEKEKSIDSLIIDYNKKLDVLIKLKKSLINEYVTGNKIVEVE